MTNYPPPYPRDDWSFDDAVPKRPDTTKHYPDVTISVDEPVFRYLGKSKNGQKQLALIRRYFDGKKKIRLGGVTVVSTTPTTNDREKGAFQQNRDRTDSQKTLHPGSMPVLNECMKDLFEIVLQQQQKKRQSARLPMVAESFPDRSGTVDQRLQAAKQHLDILNEKKRDENESKAATIIEAIKEQATAQALLRDVLTVGEYLRARRFKDVELEQKYNNKTAKRLGQIIDLNNLPPVRENFVGGAETLLGLGADTVAQAYGLGSAYSTLKRTVRAFRNRRSHHDVSSLVRMAPITKPEKPKPSYAHQKEFDAFVARNERRKAQRAVWQRMWGNSNGT
jgi:hypothetical protein